MKYVKRDLKPLTLQAHKMVKRTQTIRWLLPTNCLCVFDHFVGLALKDVLRDCTPSYCA